MNTFVKILAMDGKALIASLLEIAFIARKNIDYFINTVYKIMVFMNIYILIIKYLTVYKMKKCKPCFSINNKLLFHHF